MQQRSDTARHSGGQGPPQRGRADAELGRPASWRPTLYQVGVAVAALSAVWFLLRLAYPFGPVVLSWMHLPFLPAIGAVAAAQVARLPGMAAPARRIWNSLAGSAIVVSLTTFSMMHDALTGPDAPRSYYSPLTLVLFMIPIAMVLWAALRMPTRRRSRRQWIRVALDISTVLVASCLVLTNVTSGHLATGGVRWGVIVPLGLLGMLVAIKVSLTGASGVDGRALRVLACTMLISSLTACIGPLLDDRPDLNIVMVAIPPVYGGLLWAVDLQRRALQGPTVARRRRRRLPFSVLPYAAIGCSDALLLSAAQTTPEQTSSLIVGSVALTGLVVVRQMMSFFDNRRYQELLAYQASHDELTGLTNRGLFQERAEKALATGAPGTVAVAMVDLDDFKGINDRLGHSVGDALIVAVGARLRGCVKDTDTVARFGGDEFAILLTDLRPGDSDAVAGRVLDALNAPVTADDHDLLIQASIGIADNAPGTQAGRRGSDDLLRHADIAMYAAKELGKNRYMHYDAAMEARTVEHSELGAALSWAVERGELRMLYQPIVDLPSGRVVAVEALVRWHHPRDGVVSPVKFIPVAERTGLIVPIGVWVLRTACAQAAEWRRRLGDRAPERITVNVSARQLLDPDLPQTVATILAETGLEPERLTVEITETAVFGGGRAVETVTAIHALGVSIALDDFGTGHSSLGLLRTCPVNVPKVDKSFVDDITGSTGEAAITTAIIEIAQALGIRAIAEGVETSAQAERLHDMGYRMAQGFHFARPLTAAAVEELLPVPEVLRAAA